MTYPRISQMTPEWRKGLLRSRVSEAVRWCQARGKLDGVDSTDISDLVAELADLGVRVVPTLVRYELDGWSALYEDGELYENVGDSYLSDERVAAWAGVEERHGQYEPFQKDGNINRSTIPPTLTEVEARAERARQAKQRAEELRAEAARILAEADALEGKG